MRLEDTEQHFQVELPLAFMFLAIFCPCILFFYPLHVNSSIPVATVV